jgi:hypothetical protein
MREEQGAVGAGDEPQRRRRRGKIDAARDPDAFPEPKWLMQSLADLIDKPFTGRMIMREDHPALLRLIGAKQSVS